MKNNFKKNMARRIQGWLKEISIQSVGRSIPINFYEPEVPKEVLRLAEKWNRKRGGC